MAMSVRHSKELFAPHKVCGGRFAGFVVITFAVLDWGGARNGSPRGRESVRLFLLLDLCVELSLGWKGVGDSVGT